MQYSTNYNMNKPELNEQYRLSHWNDNTDIIDTELKRNADNISDEATRATNAETALQNITNATFKIALLNFCYPIGSLYWSSKSTDPSTLFGGTWTQIKDRFIWAKGDSDTVNATGGAKTVTLTTENLPSHTHSFTPSGTVSSHTHSFTPSGTIAITTNPTFAGSAVTSGTNNRGHTHTLNNGNTSSAGTVATAGFRGVSVITSSTINTNDTTAKTLTGTGDGYQMGYSLNGSGSGTSQYESSGIITYSKGSKVGTGNQSGNSIKISIDATHRHQLTASGYLYGKTDDESQNHTHSVTASGTISGGAYKFTGTAGTTGGSTPTFTGSAGTTGGTGGGTAHNNMPPYIVKYCWERTA